MLQFYEFYVGMYTIFFSFVFNVDIGIVNNHEIVVADVTSPRPVTIVIKYNYGMEH